MNGNGSKTAIVTMVLSLVLGAGTIAGTTSAIIGWSQAKSEAVRTKELDQEIKDWKKNEYIPFKSDYDTLKGQILAELKNLSQGQGDLKKLVQDYMAGHR